MAPRDPWQPQHPLIGRLLAQRFQVASFIREGGMAQIFCGIQDEEPRHVAIKVVHPELAENAEIVARFLREAQVASNLVHPNIVRILEVGEGGELLYMVMELLFGEDLSAPIKRPGSFSEARAAQIIAEVCDALQHAHESGVIHRDIKPENIMICRQPEDPTREVVKVLDFGIAKILDAASDLKLPTEAPTSVRSVLTRVGALVGTPAYVSPEQGRAERIDHRADLYSAGVVLYELVCGRPPFEGQTALQIVAKHVQEPPPAPSTHCRVHPGLERLILEVLSKKPGSRPQTAKELAARLRQLLPELSAAPTERWGAAPPAAQWGGAALAATIGVTAAAPAAPAAEPDPFDHAETRRIDLGAPESDLPPTPRASGVPNLAPAAQPRDVSPDALNAIRQVLGATPLPRSAGAPVVTPRRLDFRPDHPLIGRVLNNRFRLASFVREGGMAQVFCGTQQGEPHNVAIKIVHPELTKDKEVVARFLREAKLAARLSHRNVVRVLAVGQDGEHLYLVMELLFGEDLSAPIRQRGSYSEAHAASIIADVCEALQHAHDQGVVHRDIKPENVMLCRQPEAPLEEVVKVLDFGIAKVLDAKLDAGAHIEAPTGVRSALTRVGALVGTPTYMSPEQGTARPVDHRSDIYSAGVLLYELLCGIPPFQGETPLQIIARHVREPPRPPSEITPVHPALEAVVLRALGKDPAARPQSAKELAAQLRSLLPQLSSVAGVSSAPVDRWLNRPARPGPPQAPPDPAAPVDRQAFASRRSAEVSRTQRSSNGGASSPAGARASNPHGPASSPTSPPASHPDPGAASNPDIAMLRAMKQTMPLKQRGLPGAPPGAAAPASPPVDRPLDARASTAPAGAPLRPLPPPVASPVAAAAPDRKLQARVDSLAKTQRLLMILVVVAFSVIAALVVTLILKERR